MCGIILIRGSGSSPELFQRMLDTIRTRGELQETFCAETLLLGVQRLRIVDRDRALQPWKSADDRWALCYNGEIYNLRELRSELAGLGHALRSDSDTEVVLESFLEWGEEAVHHLRGEFAFAITELDTRRVFLARDPVGVKPLYWSQSQGRLYVASEVKALVPVAAPISEVPPGYRGWAMPAGAPKLGPYVDLLQIGDDDEPITNPEEASRLVRDAVVDSIRCRVDTDLKVGVILSGGLDSTITLLHVASMHPDCVAFTIGTKESEDIHYAKRVARELGVDHEILEMRPNDITASEVREAIRVSELTEYGDIINAVVSNRLFRHVHDRGVKVVLSGDGSDELFGGYEIFAAIPDESRQRLFQHIVRTLCRTELQRVDRTSMGHGVEVRVPFLDLSVVRLALRLPIDLKVRDNQEKWILRHAFADMLPDYIRIRRKNPMSYSSGVHERIRLYRPVFARYYKACGYELAGGLRRDFWYTLERSGMDLDRALAEDAAELDHTPLEHARDLAGALRWNVAAALHGLTRRVREQRSPDSLPS